MEFLSFCNVHVVYYYEHFYVFEPSLRHTVSFLTLYIPEMKIAEFANSVDLDEVAHDEPIHLDLHCLPYSL